jgi:hypothetical protein
MPLTVYVASKSRHWPFWQALRAAGVPILCSWIDAEFNRTGADLTKDAWARHWQLCVDQEAAADVTLFYAAEDERHMGALVEVGAALANGKMVYAVSPDFSVLHHPRVRRFTSLEHAVGAIMAQAAGERAREIMQAPRKSA